MAQLRPLEDQYLLNGLALNPAYAGSEDLLSLTLLHRTQWLSFDGAPSTFTFGIHAPLKNEKIALGLLVVNDQLGFSNETRILGNYAFRLKLGPGRLSMGLAGGVFITNDDQAKIASVDQDDEVLMASRKSFTMPDFSTGIYYYTGRYFAGLSMPDFVQHTFNEDDGKVSVNVDLGNTNYLFTTGYKLKLSDNFDVLPSTLIKYNPQSAGQLDLNLNLIYKDRIWLGASYRTKNTLLYLLQVSVNRQFKIAYAYGTTFSELKDYQKGTHEIMIKYNFDYLLDVLSPRNF